MPPLGTNFTSWAEMETTFTDRFTTPPETLMIQLNQLRQGRLSVQAYFDIFMTLLNE